MVLCTQNYDIVNRLRVHESCNYAFELEEDSYIAIVVDVIMSILFCTFQIVKFLYSSG